MLEDCGLRTTFSQTFASEDAAEGAILSLVMAIGAGVNVNTYVGKDGKITAETTFSCEAYRASRASRGGEGSHCLLEELSAAGIKFPSNLRSQCLVNKA